MASQVDKSVAKLTASAPDPLKRFMEQNKGKGSPRSMWVRPNVGSRSWEGVRWPFMD